jgi:hypothetical protein
MTNKGSKMPKLLTDPQAIFDAAVRGLHAQGKRSGTTTSGRCYYRSASGKCGIGHLIPDDRYKTEMDYPDTTKVPSTGIRTLIGYYFPEWIGLENLMTSIQSAHDYASYHKHNLEFTDVNGECGIATRYRNVAEHYNLNPAVVNKLWPQYESTRQQLM